MIGKEVKKIGMNHKKFKKIFLVLIDRVLFVNNILFKYQIRIVIEYFRGIRYIVKILICYLKRILLEIKILSINKNEMFSWISYRRVLHNTNLSWTC